MTDVSDDIYMQITTDKAKEEWNALADEYNQWMSLTVMKSLV